MASPKKSFATQVSEWIRKMPSLQQPTSEGDNDLVAKRTLLADVVKGCLEYPDAILKVHCTYKKHVTEKEGKFQPEAPAAEQFQKLVAVCNVDEAFLYPLVTELTDLELADLTKICSIPDQWAQIVEGVFQIPVQIQMLPKLQIKQVMRRFLVTRHESARKPMQTLKALGGFSPDGLLNWAAAGVYTPKFGEDGKLVSIVHRSGDEVAITSAFDRNTPIRYNFSDWRACFRNEPFPDQKIHLFFKACAKGPYSMKSHGELTMKGSKYASLVNDAFVNWDLDRQRCAAPKASTDILKAAQERERATQEKKRIAMSEARQKGLAYMKIRKAQSDAKYHRAPSNS